MPQNPPPVPFFLLNDKLKQCVAQAINRGLRDTLPEGLIDLSELEGNDVDAHLPLANNIASVVTDVLYESDFSNEVRDRIANSIAVLQAVLETYDQWVQRELRKLKAAQESPGVAMSPNAAVNQSMPFEPPASPATPDDEEKKDEDGEADTNPS